MDFSRQIEDNRRVLLVDLLRRLDAKLNPFHYALDTFLTILFQAVLPKDWSQQWHAFVQEQQSEGFTIAASSVAEMETWIEAWAKDCKLWPEEAEQFADEEDGDESESTFIISVIPDVSGLNRGKKPASTTAQVVVPKIHLPADIRGTWIEGTKGNGVFKFHDVPENKILAGKSFRYTVSNIAVAGFPEEAYYLKSATMAGVTIDKLTGFEADKIAADAAMRLKLGNPHWQRPAGYIWNHAGPPGSKILELVDKDLHAALAHRGPAAEPRAAARLGGFTGRAVAIFTVYLNIRDVLRASGALQPEYSVIASTDYYFKADDGSVFVVWPSTFYRSGLLEFILGPRKGEVIQLTNADVESYQLAGQKKWGKYIPGTLFREPRFLPGTDLKSLPLYEEDRYGLLSLVGWIDEDGVHYYGIPGPKFA